MQLSNVKTRIKLAFLVTSLSMFISEGAFSGVIAAERNELLQYENNKKVKRLDCLVTEHSNKKHWLKVREQSPEIGYILGSCINNPRQNSPSFETLHAVGQAYYHSTSQKDGHIFFVYCASIFSFTTIPNNVKAIAYMWLDFFSKLNVPHYKDDMRQKALMLDGSIASFFETYIEGQNKAIETQKEAREAQQNATRYYDIDVITQSKMATNLNSREDENTLQISSPRILKKRAPLMRIDTSYRAPHTGMSPKSAFSPYTLQRLAGNSGGTSTVSSPLDCLSEQPTFLLDETMGVVKDRLNMRSEEGGE